MGYSSEFAQCHASSILKEYIMTSLPLTSLVTLLVVLLLFFTALNLSLIHI